MSRRRPRGTVASIAQEIADAIDELEKNGTPMRRGRNMHRPAKVRASTAVAAALTTGSFLSLAHRTVGGPKFVEITADPDLLDDKYQIESQ